jgi:hypothetical protein
MNHKAIYALYSNVVTIDDALGAFDKDGNKVTIDESAVNAWQDPDQYKYDRQQAYASLAEQLDMQYWDRVNGTDTWKQHIDAVKTAHPKPTE